MRGDAGEARPAGRNLHPQLVEAAARCRDGLPVLERRAVVEDEEVDALEAEAREARRHLRPHGCAQVVDLVDQEDGLAPPPERPADDLLAVAVLVGGRGVDDVEARVEGPDERGHAGLDRHRAVGQVPDPEAGDGEAGRSERATGGETGHGVASSPAQAFRSTRPGRAPVCFPRSTTAAPFTRTWTMPSG